jgi:anti-sigma regulatory factor (Ser/Thr protein kinase)
VGGDLYDVFALRDGKIGVAIADVSGKGLAGCLVSSMVSALLRAFRDEESSPAALLVRLERTLAGSLQPGTFVTMTYGILDPAAGTFRWASAGHCPLLVHRSGLQAPLRFSTKGVPVGAVRGGALAKTVHDETIRLEPGDVLLQFTDGANEAFDASGLREFGVERIEAALRAAASSGVHAVLTRVRADVDAWSAGRAPDDDLTLLAIAAPPPAERHASGPAPLALLEAARRGGDSFTMEADLDALAQLRPWIAARPGLGELDGRGLALVESALYEVCANVIEHGYGRDRGGRVEIGWVRDATAAPPSGGPSGSFVVRDEGQPFVPAAKRVDFSDSEVRRRGRGLGLPIIHGAMARVDYHPRTSEGNITLLKLEPAGRAEEVSHG